MGPGVSDESQTWSVATGFRLSLWGPESGKKRNLVECLLVRAKCSICFHVVAVLEADLSIHDCDPFFFALPDCFLALLDMVAILLANICFMTTISTLFFLSTVVKPWSTKALFKIFANQFFGDAYLG